MKRPFTKPPTTYAQQVEQLAAHMPWPHNRIILSQSKHPEERELERQFDGALFERTMLQPAKVSPVVTQMQPQAKDAFKDDKVVEYAFSRTASPALVAQYQTQLPDKALLQAKLHEFYLLNMADSEGASA